MPDIYNGVMGMSPSTLHSRKKDVKMKVEFQEHNYTCIYQSIKTNAVACLSSPQGILMQVPFQVKQVDSIILI
jgi:hypothetical protein